MCFFAARLVFFRTLNPFITAYLAVFIGTKRFPIAMLLSLCGLGTIATEIYTFRYFAAVAVMGVMHAVAVRGGVVSRVKRAVLGAVSLFIGGAIYAAAQWFSPYYFTIAVVEAVLTGFLCYVLYAGVELITGSREQKTVTNEEALSLAVLCAGVLPGMSGVYIFTVPLTAVAATVIVLETIKRSGAAAGIASAALTGMFMYFTGMYRGELVSVLILAAVGAALAAKARYMSPFGFALGASSAFFAYRDIATWNYAAGIAVGGAISSVLPQRLYLAVTENVTTGVEQARSCALQMQHICVRRMKEFSAVLDRIVKLSERNGGIQAPEEGEMVDKIAANVCGTCQMRELCWQKTGSVRPVFELILAEVKNGTRYVAQSLPDEFAEGCRHLHELCAYAARVYDEAMLNVYWQQRLSHSKKLMTTQLKNAAELSQRLCDDISLRMNRDDAISDALYTKIYENGVRGVSVCGDELCREVFITLEETVDKAVIDGVIKQVGEYMKSGFCIVDCDNDNQNRVTQLHIREQPIYKIAAYATDEVKCESGVSGDCHTYMQLDGGRYLLALADGMGSGERAREESAASIEMYEDFISAGFDRGVSLDVINSVLLMKDNCTDGEKFSTLDICTIDLYTGRAEFVKIGAVATFIIRDGKAETLHSSTLPVGILGEVDTDIYERFLKKNDIVLMVTDGVLDSTGNVVGNEDWIVEMIENTEVVTPKNIADKILEQAKRNCGDVIKDDMTVLAAKIY
jgi:stage II sporulation protein E